MALLQALLAWIGRSLGSLLNTLFGWAVLALFGRVSRKRHNLLVALTAMAAFWPILLLGIPYPQVAATLITFLPVPHEIRELLPNPAFWQRGSNLQIALYPHDILIRGQRRRVAWTRGALVEGLACGPGLQTVGVAAQALERRLHEMWDEPEGPEAGARRRGDPREGLLHLIRDLRAQPIDTEDWQVLYRKAEQFRRLLDDEPLLLRLLETTDRPAAEPARRAGSSGT